MTFDQAISQCQTLVAEKLKNTELKPGDIQFLRLFPEDKRYIPLTAWNDAVGLNHDHYALGSFRVVSDKLPEGVQIIASWDMYYMPGCCGICISTNVRVSGSYRNKGLGKIFNEFRQIQARGMGFSLLFCTDVDHNVNQRKLLKTNGFTDIANFTNTRTGNLVHLSMKLLPKGLDPWISKLSGVMSSVASFKEQFKELAGMNARQS